MGDRKDEKNPGEKRFRVLREKVSLEGDEKR